MNFNFDYDRLLKLVQGLSFTSFLILLVVAMSYAVFHLYSDSRTDWGQIQTSIDKMDRMSSDVEQLMGRIDRLIDELNSCARSGTSLSAPPRGPLQISQLPGPVFGSVQGGLNLNRCAGVSTPTAQPTQSN